MSADMSRVVDGVAKVMYAEGRTGLDIAEMWISSVIAALIETQNARAANPGAVPQWGPEATPHIAARRVIARLLDAGWLPPDADCLNLANFDQTDGDPA